MQVILTRDNVSIPWGFRLKGGAEFNLPLSILKVSEGSPSHYKLEFGDTLLKIGNYSTVNLKHDDALNIIRMFDNTLPLVVQRDQWYTASPAHLVEQHQQQQPIESTTYTSSVNPTFKFNQQPSTPHVWKPPSLAKEPTNVVSPMHNQYQTFSYPSSNTAQFSPQSPNRFMYEQQQQPQQQQQQYQHQEYAQPISYPYNDPYGMKANESAYFNRPSNNLFFQIRRRVLFVCYFKF